MTDMGTLTLDEFLLARIAEDETVLTRTEAYQHASHGYDAPGTYSPTCPTCRQFVWGTKQRALAECEAKRRIVEAVRYIAGLPEGMVMPDWESAMGLERALQAMAAVYADHPDYRSAWRP